MDALERLRAVDWVGQREPTICSQLIMPVLVLLGYGEHTLHKVKEQQSYALRDPTISKGSRRVKLDYQPRVYEEGLWVMEAKGERCCGSGQDAGAGPGLRHPSRDSSRVDGHRGRSWLPRLRSLGPALGRADPDSGSQ